MGRARGSLWSRRHGQRYLAELDPVSVGAVNLGRFNVLQIFVGTQDTQLEIRKIPDKPACLVTIFTGICIISCVFLAS